MDPSIKLGDRVFLLKWTDRAEARLSSLDRPPTFADLRRPKRCYYAMCAIIWASIVERGHPYLEPEDLAESLKTQEQIAMATNAIGMMLEEAYPPDPDQKKSGLIETTSEMPGSADGLSPSATSASGRVSIRKT